MFRDIRELFSVLDSRQRYFFLKVSLLASFQAIVEVLSVLILIPFMSVVGNLDLIKTNIFFSKIFDFFKFQSEYQFIIFFSVLVIFFFFFSAFVSYFNLKKLSYLGVSTGMDLSKNLYRYYLSQSWLYHTRNNTSSITNKISMETGRVTASIIMPLILTISKLFLIFFMYVTLIALNPKYTIYGTFIFLFFYYFIFKNFEKRLSKHGKNLSIQQEKRFKSINEGLGGIKQILLSNNQMKYLALFNEASDNYSKSYTKIQILTLSPKYLIELIAVIAVMLIILVTVAIDKKNALELLPLLSVFGLAGYKILPAFQTVYFLFASIKGSFASFINIKNDLNKSLLENSKEKSEAIHKFEFKDKIYMKDIYFNYGNDRNATINGLSLEIIKNKKIGIVGASGAGKSTLVDIFLGLLNPTKGKFIVDSTEINEKNVKSWQKNVSYVPQDIYLINDTIKNNIIFGKDFDPINHQKLEQSLDKAGLNIFVKDLPQGIETFVGERGVQLSGGQKQRIAIARALYHNCPVLVLDEATSSLDTITEKEIMNNVDKFFKEKTILIIAHRISTIRNCDFIYFIDNGKIIDKGNYEDLITRNKAFRLMAGKADTK